MVVDNRVAALEDFIVMTDLLGNDLNLQYELLSPEIALVITAALVLFADAFRRELKIGQSAIPAISIWKASASGNSRSI